MARIRSIKPEFFTSEQVAECSTNARLLFVGMWCFADDRGVHPASTKRLKMEVYPGDSFTEAEIQGMVDELLAVGLLGSFEADGKSFWFVTGWQHQKIDRPNPKYPSPPETSEAGEFGERSSNDRRNDVEDSASDQRSITPGSGSGSGSSGQVIKPPVVPQTSKRQNGRAGPGQTGKLEGIDSKDLADSVKVLAWLTRSGPKLGLDPEDHETRLRTLAAAQHAAGGESPGGLFVHLMRCKAAGDDKRPWSKLSDDDLQAGKTRLREFTAATSKPHPAVLAMADKRIAGGPTDEA